MVANHYLLQEILAIVGLGIWVLILAFNAWGTWLARRKFLGSSETRVLNLQPVSILKPVKGVEGNLEENVLSFFNLTYPQYEILFSIAEVNDPAVNVIQKIIDQHPQVNAKLIIGDVAAGPNPKVNNLIKSFELASHDWILISDCNVKVKPDYLLKATARFTEDVGIVSAVVSGREPRGIGGWLESVFLNSFYARWMLISHALKMPVVIGKSMLFRKSQAQRFGGLRALAPFLAEDYVAGLAMEQLNLKIELMDEAIEQPLNFQSAGAFWSRHLRWGRIRKSQALGVFAIEPLLSFWGSGLMAIYGLNFLFQVPWPITLALHIYLWAFADFALMSACGSKLTFQTMFSWFVRECIALPLWLHIAVGNSVKWRGRKLHLGRSGLLK